MSELYDAVLVQYERMEALISEYVRNCTELYSGSTAGGMGNYLRKVVTGWDAYSASPIHMEYFNEMKKAAETLAESLGPLAAEDRGQAEELAGKAVRLLLKPAEDEVRFMDVSFMADDQHADGLLRFLSDEELSETYRWIDREHEKMRTVPTQHRTFDKIREEMEARGLEVPKTGFLARLKERFSKSK